MAGSTRRWPVAVLALIGWTLFVWIGRIRNVVADDDLTGWSTAWRLALASTFVALAAATVLVPRAGVVLAWFGIAVWMVRGVDIALGDHSAAFIAVHSLLALTTIGLGVLVIRSRAGILGWRWVNQ